MLKFSVISLKLDILTKTIQKNIDISCFSFCFTVLSTTFIAVKQSMLVSDSTRNPHAENVISQFCKRSERYDDPTGHNFPANRDPCYSQLQVRCAQSIQQEGEVCCIFRFIAPTRQKASNVTAAGLSIPSPAQSRTMMLFSGQSWNLSYQL